MPGAALMYTPPSPNTVNVLYGVGILMTAQLGTAVPSDQNLGVGSAWTAAGWSYVGATDAGVSVNWTPKTVNIQIEEQPTPVAVVVDTADLNITTNINEETLAGINLALGGAGTVAVTAAGAGQPGKSVLSLSTAFPYLAAAVIGKNQQGFARVLQIPSVMSAGTVKADFRRAAAQRMYALTLNAVCPFSSISWTDLTAVATS
ncbi:MAG TPA: hypothetical protein VK586_01275 [Streptosporangiaceae bacterium]|nr:hypothetical protein [Streptosporangiaceae bacterium]